MQRHHTGSGRRRVIPLDWSAHHRPILAGTRDATVTLRHAGGTPGDFDPDAGTRPIEPFEPYFGAGAETPNARVQVVTGTDRDVLAGEQEVTTVRYAVTLDYEVTGVDIGDLCKVTAMDDNGDADLVDRDLTVEAISRGSLHWERLLICTDNLETQG